VEGYGTTARGHLVLVEDEDAIVRPLVSALEREGFEVRRFARAEDAIDRLDVLNPDAVILDVALPGMSGLKACQVIRRRSTVPVLMLTARGAEAHRLSGFAAGADDYLPKPFSVHELVARIRAILRRTRAGGNPREQVIAVGDLRLDVARREVRSGANVIALTPREFDLLELLMRRSPEVVHRKDLIHEVWDAHWRGPTKTLDFHVSQLRRKLGDDPNEPRYIHTIRRVGYQVRDRCAGD
jgi:DNA-binding response OmpR family regulator